MSSEKGYLYCIYNDAFKSMGDHVYKLGRTKNLKNRIASYSTYYPTPCTYKYTSGSRVFDNSLKAERTLFFILRKHRLSKKREFFDCELSIIKDTFDRVCKFTDIMISQMYKAIINDICPPDILERIEKGNDLSNKEWFEYEKGNIDSIYAYLEQFRFKPKNPSMYPTYVPPHLTEINKLILKVDDGIQIYIKESNEHEYECDGITFKLKYLDI